MKARYEYEWQDSDAVIILDSELKLLRCVVDSSQDQASPPLLRTNNTVCVVMKYTNLSHKQGFT